ncbi:KH domain-containing protein [Candidatus Peregrinibacteria bacterium]|nr:KH domain-containing protein [Candidatus Peregrinibacteria bacterium]
METEKLLQEILEELIKYFTEPSVKIEITSDNTTYKANIAGLKNAAMLIGYHGETLHSLQHIFKALAFKRLGEMGINIVLDVDNYKKEHEDNILNLAERKVELLRKTKKIQILPPMPAYLRRIVHMHFVQEKFQDIQTESVGENDHRQVTLKLKSEEKA